jgi:hypothetical protein
MQETIGKNGSEARGQRGLWDKSKRERKNRQETEVSREAGAARTREVIMKTILLG